MITMKGKALSDFQELSKLSEFYQAVNGIKESIDDILKETSDIHLAGSYMLLQRFDPEQDSNFDMQNLVRLYQYPQLRQPVKQMVSCLANNNQEVQDAMDKSTVMDRMIAKNIIDRFKDNPIIPETERDIVDLVSDVDGCLVMLVDDYNERAKIDKSFAKEYLPIANQVHKEMNEKFEKLLYEMEVRGVEFA